MQKLKRFLRHHTWALLILAILIFIPQSFSYQAKLNMRIIVTGMAIDKVEEGYEVTVQVVMPSPGSESGGGTATLGFISERGANLYDGIQKTAAKIGKTAGLSHMNFVIIGQSMLEENLAETLDYFIRNPNINAAVMMLISATSGKEMLTKTKDLDLSTAVGMQKVFIYKQNSLNGLMMPIEEFVSDAFGISKSGVASGILITSEGEEKLGENTDATLDSSDSSGESSGAQQSGNSGSGGSSNQTQQEGKNSTAGGSQQEGSQMAGAKQSGRIKYYNDIYYFKNGEFIDKLTEEDELLAFFFVIKNASSGEYVVKDITGGILKNATIGLQFREEKVKRKVSFKEGKPVFKFDITIKDIQIMEILNEGQPSEKIYLALDDDTISLIKKAIADQVKEGVMKVFEKTKNDEVDIFNIGDACYQTHPKEWEEFYEKYGEKYLDEVKLEIETTVKNIN